MKLTSRRLIALFLLILLSVGFGFAFDGIATAIEKHKYARPAAYRDLIASAAAESRHSRSNCLERDPHGKRL